MFLKEEYEHFRSNMLDVMGRFRIKSLFWEIRPDRGEDASLQPLFSTKSHDHKVKNIIYPSLKKIYMSYDHIPGYEYEFAMDIFGSWEHWAKLNESSLKPMLTTWREELAIRIKSEAIKKLMVHSLSDTAVGANAARYLADEGYVPKKVGRVSKEEKARELKIAAGVRDDLAGDMERLGLEVVNGGK